MTRSHTSSISRETVEKIALALRLALQPCLVSGGVFSCDSDTLWPLSAGSDVSYSGPDPDESVIATGLQQLASACVSSDDRFTIVTAAWDNSQLTVITNVDIKQGEVIGKYHGYYLKSSELSNERYNACVGGTGGEVTVDPCWGEDAPLPEWQNSVTHRINEPPPGFSQNCMWKMVRSSSPEILAARDIQRGEELLIFYGDGHSPLRDYRIADDLHWLETEDSYLSD